MHQEIETVSVISLPISGANIPIKNDLAKDFGKNIKKYKHYCDFIGQYSNFTMRSIILHNLHIMKADSLSADATGCIQDNISAIWTDVCGLQVSRLS